MTRHRDFVTASDGLPARNSGEWGKTKLDFLSRFGPIALDATARMPTRCYVDMFAGPGLNVGRQTGEEFLGSPLKALDLVGPRFGKAFTHVFFVNETDTAYDALGKRIDRFYELSHCPIPRGNVRTVEGDVNAKLSGILDTIHPLSYLFVFADPDKPSDLPWRSVEALKRHRGHQSVDLYVLFPLMALRRLIDYSGPVTRANARALSEFYGSDAWQQCERFRQSEALRRDFAECLEQVYLERLRTLWTHAEHICNVHRGSGQGLYTMLFATNHDAGRKIGTWAKKRARLDSDGRADQGTFDLGGG